MICKHILLITFLNESTLILLHAIRCFHLFLSNTNNSIYYSSFVCAQLNAFKYCNLSVTIQLNISHLFIHSLMIKQFYFK